MQITPETIQALTQGIEEESKGESLKSLAEQRDKLIIEFLKGRAAAEQNNSAADH